MSLSSMSRVYNMSAELWWRWNQEVCYWITPSVQGHLLGSYNFLLVSTCCNLWSFIFFICHCSISSAKKIQSKFASSVISYRKWVKLRGEPGSCEWHLSPILWQLTHITSHHITKFDCKYRARPHTTMCSKGSCQGWEGKLELHWDICARQWVVG